MVLALLLTIGLIIIGLSILYQITGAFSWFWHDKLGWHQPIKDTRYEGVHEVSFCKYCGKKIRKDSQGNWFLFE